jgi:hypothetical protein
MIKNLKGKYWNMYIHALSGQVVLSQELEGLETFYLNVDHLESGSYFVTIRNNLQNEHVSQLIIKP